MSRVIVWLQEHAARFSCYGRDRDPGVGGDEVCVEPADVEAEPRRQESEKKEMKGE